VETFLAIDAISNDSLPSACFASETGVVFTWDCLHALRGPRPCRRYLPSLGLTTVDRRPVFCRTFAGSAAAQERTIARRLNPRVPQKTEAEVRTSTLQAQTLCCQGPAKAPPSAFSDDRPSSNTIPSAEPERREHLTPFSAAGSSAHVRHREPAIRGRLQTRFAIRESQEQEPRTRRHHPPQKAGRNPPSCKRSATRRGQALRR